jgi:hypothetical protein
MKRILGLSIALVAILVLVGCEEEVTLVAPNVTIQVIDNGATIRLTWTEVTDADGYYIYRDGVIVDTIDEATTTTYDADTPAQLYEVSAYAGENESATDQIDCGPVETTSLTVYGNSDPNPAHPSGFGFNTSGTAVPLALSDSTNWPDLDYYLNDANPTQGLIDIVSPGDHVPAYNDQENASSNSGTDYDGLDIADAPGSYSTQTELAENAVFSLWIDPDGDGWGATNDHFAKMQVESISGATAPYTVVITCAYQTIPGLRWVVTD